MNIEQVKAENDGQLPAYAWPGGYPIFYVTSDNDVLCPKCANANEEEEAIADGGINWENASFLCDNCYERIESAYAEDEVAVPNV